MSTYTVLLYKALALPPGYRPLIFSKWLRSLRHGNDYYRLAEPKAFYEAYQRYISNILRHPDTKIMVAVLTEDRDVVLGFSISRGNILDYVHVQAHQRRQGIGKNLVPPGIDTITHLTKTGLTLWGSKYGHWRFNPFA